MNSSLGCNLQYKLLYYPDFSLPSEEFIKFYNINFWPYGYKDYRGFIGNKKKYIGKGTIIVFHGNAGTASDRIYYIKPLESIGYRVILAEYPKYGKRSGALGEESFINDAKETLKIAFEQYGEPIFLIGESLGCGVVASVAKDENIKINGLILITPWDTLLSVAKSVFPLLPISWFMKDKYDSIDNLKFFKHKIAVIGAEQDEIIPVKHAIKLYDSLQCSKKMFVIKGASHNTWSTLVQLSWWEEIMKFTATKDDHAG